MSKAIPKQDKDIIAKLESGMSPAQISIEYEKNGIEVSVGHCRRVKMLVEAGMTDLLEQPAGKSNRFYKNSRDYAKGMEEAYKQTLREHGIEEGDYRSVVLSAYRTEYEVNMIDGSKRIIPSGFAYCPD